MVNGMTKPAMQLIMRVMRKLFFFTWLAMLLALLINPVSASDDSETARRLSAAGEILPLETILEQAQQYQPGRLVEVEFEQQGERYIYEIEILNSNGIVWELKLDARTGQLLKHEQED